MKQTDNLDTNFSRNDASVLQALSAKYRFIIWYIYVKKRKNETQNDLPGGLKLAEIEDRSCHLNFELVGLCKARLQVAENKIKKKKKGNKNLIRLFSSEQNCTPPPCPHRYVFVCRSRAQQLYLPDSIPRLRATQPATHFDSIPCIPYSFSRGSR